MPIQAAAFLPLLETLLVGGGSAGTAASLGRGVAAGGALEGLLGGMGFAKTLGSAEEMGGALRRLSDLQVAMQAAEQRIGQNRQQQARIAEKAREDERLYMMSDPRHREQLAALESQSALQRREMLAHQRELAAVNARVYATNNPGAAGMQRAATVLAGAGALNAIKPAGGSDQFTMSDMISPLGYWKKQVAATAKNLAGAAGNIGQFVAGPVEGEVIQQGFQWMSDTVKQLGNPSGMILQLSKLPGLLDKWGQALVESKQHLMQFSPALRAAFVEGERRGIMRDIASAGRTGGTTAELSRALDDLKDTIQPMRDTVTNALNTTLTTGINLLTNLVHIAQGIYVLAQHYDPTGTLKDIRNILKAQEKTDAAGSTEFIEFLTRAVPPPPHAATPRKPPRRPPGERR